jgi:hypothetical protein
MYETFEKLLVVWYKFGLAMNDGLNASFNDLLARAEVQFKTRLFMSIYYKAEKWAYPQTVSTKAEAHAGGTNRRAGEQPTVSRQFPEAAYDDYTRRGKSENRNKVLLCSLRADRLNDHCFVANFFRLYYISTRSR